MVDSYVRGVDSIELEFTLTDEDGVIIDTTTLNDVIVELITSRKSGPENTVYWTGSILGGEIDDINGATGVIKIYLDYTDTTTWTVSKIYYARITIIDTDVDFSSGEKYSVSIAEAFKLIVE